MSGDQMSDLLAAVRSGPDLMSMTFAWDLPTATRMLEGLAEAVALIDASECTASSQMARGHYAVCDCICEGRYHGDVRRSVEEAMELANE